MASVKEREDFIKKIAEIAIELCEKREKWVLPSVTIAQAACESKWGTSTAMTKANGLFGYKVGSGRRYGTAWKGKSYSTKTKEYYNGYVSITDNFRSYDTVAESVEDYMDLICSLPRYKAAVNNKDARSTITAIKNGGYATSPTYISTIMNIIKSNGLQKYDDVVLDPAEQRYKIGKNYILQSDLYIREEPDGKKKPYLKLTTNAKSNAKMDASGYGILKKGTVVTCKEIKSVGESLWIRIPSGWICAVSGKGIIYVK